MHELHVENLFRRTMGHRGSLRVRRVPKGFSTECWRIDAGSDHFLMKIFLRDTRAASLANIVAAVKLALAAGVNTPRILIACADTKVCDRPFLIQEWLEGTDVEELVQRQQADGLDETFRNLGTAVARLHVAPVAHRFGDIEQGRRAATLKTYLRGSLEKAIEGLKRRSVISVDHLERMESRTEERIDGLADSITPSLVHLDLYLPNILACKQGNVALLDFEHAKFTDRLEDFVKLRIWVFSEHPELEAPFMAGYWEVADWPQDGEERMETHLSVYLLSALRYFIEHEPSYVPIWLSRMRSESRRYWGLQL